MDGVNVKSNGHSHVVAEAFGPELDLELDGLSVEELRDRAIELGVPITHKRVQAGVAEQRRRARSYELARARELSPYAAPQWADNIQRGLAMLRDLWAAALGSLVINFFPTGMLVLAAVVEGSRFAAGVSLFDPARASLYAVAVIFAFVTVLWRIAHDRANGDIPEQTRFSLRFAFGSMWYALGLGRLPVIGLGAEFAPRRATFAELAVRSKGALQWLIILVGTWGGLAVKMTDLPGTNALADVRYIATQTGLRDFGSYAGGFLIAAALLPVTEFAVQMVYEQFNRATGGNLYSPFDPSLVDTGPAEDQAEAEYLKALLIRELSRRRA